MVHFPWTSTPKPRAHTIAALDVCAVFLLIRVVVAFSPHISFHYSPCPLKGSMLRGGRGEGVIGGDVVKSALLLP
jgi:hypothetical protein